MRTWLFTALALAGFAANSLLCRAALSDGGARIDAASFTLVRLASGALALATILWVSRRGRGGEREAPAAGVTAGSGKVRGGSWVAFTGSLASAAALFLYAACFSFAYLRIGAGTGALLLFGCVQATMLGFAVVQGDRPRWPEWLGMAIAFGGLVWLVAPGVSAPDPVGATLMAFAGVAWGVYSLRGPGSTHPLATTAGNFLRSLPFALLLFVAVAVLRAPPRASVAGLELAIASGALASGVGYSLWYAALPHLRSAQAAVVQLFVPVIASASAVPLLGERATPRLIVAAALVVIGVGLAIRSRAHVRA